MPRMIDVFGVQQAEYSLLVGGRRKIENRLVMFCMHSPLPPAVLLLDYCM